MTPDLYDILQDFDIDQNIPSLFQKSYYYSIDSFVKLKSDKIPTDYFSIFNTNARSLLKNKTEYDVLLESFGFHMKFDILSFTETWFNSELEKLVSFENYNQITKHKLPNKEGGGIAIYIKSYINWKQRTDLSFPSDKTNLYDGIFVEIINSINRGNDGNLLLFVLYRSPSHNTINEFREDLSLILDKVKQENKTIVITGDLNIDLLKYNAHSQSTDYLDMLLSNNLIPRISLPTRVTNNSATLIDHIFSNIDTKKSIAGTIRTNITDHYCNFLLINNKLERNKDPKYITYRRVNQCSLEKFNDALKSTNWTNVTNKTDANKAYECFLNEYKSLMDEHLPIVTKRFNKNKHKKEPWITQGILRSLRTKEKLYNDMINSVNKPSHNNKTDKYKEFLKVYKQTLRMAKKLYWSKVFEATRNDMKQTWHNINYLLNKKKCKKDLPNKILVNGIEVTDETEIANTFNHHYVEIGPKLANSIVDMPGSHLDYLHNLNYPNSFYLEPCTPTEINNIIKDLKPKTSCGYDDISPKIISKSSPEIAMPLCHIANLSMQHGSFPSLMKLAKVIPIYKKGDKNNVINYRPISLLPSFSKILERLIHKRLLNYLISKKILTLSQYGFQPNRSTELAILEFQDRVAKAISSKYFCIGLFIDLSKAFDTLDHNILIDKLKSIGIRGSPLDWFKSYLSDRKQFVCFKNESSIVLNTSCGVPQGSILGPLLFLVYINDLTSSLQTSNAIMFADDTTLIFMHKKINSLLENANKDTSNLYKWFSLNRLSLNIDKTNYIIFQSKNANITETGIKISINNKPIKQVNETKFLGVFIDNKLDWKTHIANKSNQIVKVVSILARLKHTISTTVLKTIYTSLILPHLMYGISAWGNVSNDEMKRITILQKKAIRHVCNARYNSHTSPLFKKLALLNINDLYRHSCCMIYFKIKKKIINHPYFCNLLVTNSMIHNYETRQQQNIHCMNIRTNLEIQTLNRKISTIWNNLSNELKHNTHISHFTFSKKLKTNFIALYKEQCLKQNCPVCK